MQEKDSLKSFYEKNKKDVNLIYLSVNRDEKVLKEYLEESQLDKYIPVYYDRDRLNWTEYGLNRTPTTIILDDKGIIVDKWTGPRDWTKISYDDLKSLTD